MSQFPPFADRSGWKPNVRFGPLVSGPVRYGLFLRAVRHAGLKPLIKSATVMSCPPLDPGTGGLRMLGCFYSCQNPKPPFEGLLGLAVIAIRRKPPVTMLAPKASAVYVYGSMPAARSNDW